MMQPAPAHPVPVALEAQLAALAAASGGSLRRIGTGWLVGRTGSLSLSSRIGNGNGLGSLSTIGSVPPARDVRTVSRCFQGSNVWRQVGLSL